MWMDGSRCGSRREPYRYTVERGPEYRRVRGSLEIASGAEIALAIALERIVDLSRRGWWSGDLHIHRPLEDVPLLLRSEDLRVGPVLTVWNQQSLWRRRELPGELLVAVEKDRWMHLLSCEDERGGGALLYFNLREPLDFRGDGREFPSPLKHLAVARSRPHVWIDIEKPFWWDVPTWLATGRVDSMGIANNHMCRSTMYESEAWGKARDDERLPPPRGNGFYSQELYYRFLNCGFRIPPSAGSASGVLPNPVGYNRVYVRLDEPFSYASWWRGLRGRSLVRDQRSSAPGHGEREAPGPCLRGGRPRGADDRVRRRASRRRSDRRARSDRGRQGRSANREPAPWRERAAGRDASERARLVPRASHQRCKAHVPVCEHGAVLRGGGRRREADSPERCGVLSCLDSASGCSASRAVPRRRSAISRDRRTERSSRAS